MRGKEGGGGLGEDANKNQRGGFAKRRGGGSFKPRFQNPPLRVGSRDRSPGRARRGWGLGQWGSRVPQHTATPQNDRHNTLIILRYISWENVFSIIFFIWATLQPISEPALVLRLPLYKRPVTGATFPTPPRVRGLERPPPPPSTQSFHPLPSA